MWQQFSLVPDFLLVGFTLFYLGKLFVTVSRVNSDIFGYGAFGNWKTSYEKRSLLNQRVNRLVRKAA